MCFDPRTDYAFCVWCVFVCMLGDSTLTSSTDDDDDRRPNTDNILGGGWLVHTHKHHTQYTHDADNITTPCCRRRRRRTKRNTNPCHTVVVTSTSRACVDVRSSYGVYFAGASRAVLRAPAQVGAPSLLRQECDECVARCSAAARLRVPDHNQFIARAVRMRSYGDDDTL